MKKIILLFLLTIIIFPIDSFSQTDKELLDDLTTIDSDLKKMFPRWKICEPDLQIQIYKAFELLGFSKSELSMQEIEVLAAPRQLETVPYDILLLTCGRASMKSNMIEKDLAEIAAKISGEEPYDKTLKQVRQQAADTTGKEFDISLTYCHIIIPAEMPVKPSQASAIQDYLKPTDKNQAFTISLFEQNMKIGETGFWLTNQVGNDQVGYQYYTAGESKLFLKRPLYINNDTRTRTSIPYLVNVYLGGVYRITSGLSNSGGMFSWLPERNLNSNPGGRLKAGFDISMPFQPEFGLSMNVELPLSNLTTKVIDGTTFGYVTAGRGVEWVDKSSPEAEWSINKTTYVLKSTGQVTLFYNWWLDDFNPENYFRFDLGVSYAEVGQYAWYRNDKEYIDVITNQGVKGLKTYKNTEFGDWLYAKVEYRNQSVFPFGATLQYSNQHILAKGYIPLLGDWLLLEAKYTTTLRDAREYELENFFMISPILRITL